MPRSGAADTARNKVLHHPAGLEESVSLNLHSFDYLKSWENVFMFAIYLPFFFFSNSVLSCRVFFVFNFNFIDLVFIPFLLDESC